MDGYLTLLDSLSSTLPQGWLELASARQSMGASRISSVLLDLNVLSAAISLQFSQQDVDSVGSEPSFILWKWVSSDIGKCTSGEEKSREVQKQRQKTVSVFGGLVSPKLRSEQLSFETYENMLKRLAVLLRRFATEETIVSFRQSLSMP